LKNPSVDLLVVNLAVRNTTGLVTTLKEKNHFLKVIAIEDPGSSVITNIPVDATLRKPSPTELEGEEHWLGTVRLVLSD
jgi:hypothetical protein